MIRPRGGSPPHYTSLHRGSSRQTTNGDTDVRESWFSWS